LIFKEFLEELENKGIKNKYYLLDNARIHHSKIVKEYMKVSTNKLLFNVPYSPEYNPIEMIFSKIKSIVRKKSNNEIIRKLLNNIRKAIKKIRRMDLYNSYTKSLTFN
jgi:transposase